MGGRYWPHRGTVPAVILWAAAVTSAVEAVGIWAGWWILTRAGMVLTCAGVAVLALMLWWQRALVADYEGRHSFASRARLIRDVREAIEAGEFDVPGVGRGYAERYYRDGEVDGEVDGEEWPTEEIPPADGWPT